MPSTLAPWFLSHCIAHQYRHQHLLRQPLRGQHVAGVEPARLHACVRGTSSTCCVTHAQATGGHMATLHPAAMCTLRAKTCAHKESLTREGVHHAPDNCASVLGVHRLDSLRALWQSGRAGRAGRTGRTGRTGKSERIGRIGRGRPSEHLPQSEKCPETIL